MPHQRVKRPWGSGLTKFFGFKMTEEMKEAIEREARFAGISDSQFVRQAVETRIQHLRSIRKEVAKGHAPVGRPDTLSRREVRRMRARSELTEAVHGATGTGG